MKLTLSWLKTHLETDADLKILVDGLTMLGLEVDAVVDRGAALAGFRIVYIQEAEQHPNADKLRVCKVETADGIKQIVCGAPNARGGMKAVLATPGLTVPKNGMVIKASAIRGVTSEGMLCSSDELAIPGDSSGIIELPADAPIGQEFATYAGLDDPILDVKITANRADCLGVRGIARDLAAAGFGTLKPLAIERIHGHFKSPIGIHIDDRKACPLFVGRWIRGVRNGPSPAWLVRRLESIGLRPISALVDITNFMTFDLDRPLHVFDAGKIKGDLLVRSARDGESLAALNSKSYALAPGMTAIVAQTGVISLGGVIGGESTGCSDATTDVFIEAALFDPVTTAATGRKLNLQSDARYRFERGLDPAFVFDAMEIATRLVLDLAGGTPSEIVFAGEEPPARDALVLRHGRIKSLGGLDVPDAEVKRILGGLGCSLEHTETGFSVLVPPWRADIEGEADLVEEVLRIYGYHRIPPVSVPRLAPLPAPSVDSGQRRAGLIRRTLAERGLLEAVTYSFMSSGLLGTFGAQPDSLKLANPISAELDVMRPSIVPNLLLAAKRNADQGYPDGALFEIGPQYRDDSEAGQSLVAAGVRVGRKRLKSWDGQAEPVGPFDVKADVMAALTVAGVPTDNLQVTADPPGWYHPGRAGCVRLGPKTVLACFGELHPALLTELDLKGPAMGFEIMLDIIPFPKAGRARPPFRPSAFQPVERDFAFIVDQSVPAERLVRAARGADKRLISEVRLFDVYTGPGVPDGKKSLALTVTLQPIEATLTDVEIETVSRTIVEQVEKQTSATLRR